jgi:hypothetical protein
VITVLAVRDAVAVAALLAVVWRFLPAGQAFLATVICAAALGATLRPVLAATLATQVARWY